MNTIFVITGETDNHLKYAGQWLANRVARVFSSMDEVGNTLFDLPVAVLVQETKGVVPALRKISKADIVHLHLGPEAVDKARGAERFYHVTSKKRWDNAESVPLLMQMEAFWRSEKMVGRPVDERAAIRVPV